MSVEPNLRAGLRTLARQAPTAAVPEAFFDRAHARVRQRRAMTASAAVVALLALTVGLVLRPGGAGIGVGGGVGGEGVVPSLPRQVQAPPLWTASVEQSPPGAAAMIFGGEATRDDWNEGRFAVVAAASERYRVFTEFLYTPPGFEALLSPDGTRIARNRAVRSLTGDGTVIPLPGDPRAFSPDGSLLVYETGDGVNFVDGEERRPSRIGVFDLVRRVEIASIDNTEHWLNPGWSVAVSPDNARLAVQLRDQLRLYRLDTPAPTPYATVTLAGETLAGPASWRPDGRTLVTARRDIDSDTWRLVTRLGSSGEVEPHEGPDVYSNSSASPAIPDARYVRVVGWRGDRVALAVVGVPRPGAQPAPFFQESAWVPFTDRDSVRARLVELALGSPTARVLFETPAGVSELDVAADRAVEGRFREPGAPDHGPLPPTFLIGGGLLVLVIAVPLGWLLRHRRRRRTH